jgi:hypothetical protein
MRARKLRILGMGARVEFGSAAGETKAATTGREALSGYQFDSTDSRKFLPADNVG